MIHLLAHIWFWLLVSFALGAFVQWFLCCRSKEDEVDTSDTTRTAAGVVASSAKVESPTTLDADVLDASVDNDGTMNSFVEDSWKPTGFSSAPTDVDDLKRIKGVGSVIEKTLNGLGIYQFKQIGEWSHDNALWVEGFISFPGRIQREDWVEQAKTLADGGTTEFAKRVDKGDIDYENEI